MATQTRNVAGLLPGRVSDSRSRITRQKRLPILLDVSNEKGSDPVHAISAYAREISIRECGYFGSNNYIGLIIAIIFMEIAMRKVKSILIE